MVVVGLRVVIGIVAMPVSMWSDGYKGVEDGCQKVWDDQEM